MSPRDKVTTAVREPRIGKLSRRTAIKVTGSLGVGIATGGLFATNAAAGDHTFATQLKTVRASTRKYRDVATARAEGYEKLIVNPPVGHIFLKADYFDGAKFIGKTAITEPPSLLFYAPNSSAGDTDDSDLVLAGVEYHVAGDQADDPPNLFADEDASRTLKVTEEQGWHRSPVPALLDVTGLHVWAHLQNPDGVFAGPHPTIRDRLTG